MQLLHAEKKDFTFFFTNMYIWNPTWENYVPLELVAEKAKFNLDKMKPVKKWNINNLQSEQWQRKLQGSVGSWGNKLKIWQLIYDASARLNLADSFKSLFSFLYFSGGKDSLQK